MMRYIFLRGTVILLNSFKKSELKKIRSLSFHCQVRQEISTLNDELERLTTELRELVQRWNSEYKKCTVTKNKFRAVVKMLALNMSVKSPTRDCEIPSDHIEPVVPPVIVGSKNHIKKGI